MIRYAFYRDNSSSKDHLQNDTMVKAKMISNFGKDVSGHGNI